MSYSSRFGVLDAGMSIFFELAVSRIAGKVMVSRMLPAGANNSCGMMALPRGLLSLPRLLGVTLSECI